MDQGDEKQNDMQEVEKNNKTNAKKSKSKLGKGKFIVKTILPTVLPILAIFIVVGVITITVSEVFRWFTYYKGSDSVSGYASKELLTDVTTAKGIDGYYYVIDEDLVDQYIKELNNAYRDGKFYQDEDENAEALQEYEKEYEEYEKAREEEQNQQKEGTEQNQEQTANPLDEFTNDDLISWFQTEDFKDYFVRMVKAEIASSYPKIGNDASYGTYGESQTDRPNGRIVNLKDLNGDYKAQGVVQIRRSFLEDIDIENPENNAGNIIPVENIKGLIADLESRIHVNIKNLSEEMRKKLDTYANENECELTTALVLELLERNPGQDEEPVIDAIGNYVIKYSFRGGEQFAVTDGNKDVLTITLNTKNRKYNIRKHRAKKRNI